MPNSALASQNFQGPAGLGWSPVFANVADGDRIVQQITDWTGGSGIKPAYPVYVGADGLVTDIEDAATLINGVDFVGAQLRKTFTQALVDGVADEINWSTSDFFSEGMYDSLNDTVLTAPVDGYYRCEASVGHNGTYAAGLRALSIVKNGDNDNPIWTSISDSELNTPSTPSVSRMLKLSAGDEISILANFAGANVTINRGFFSLVGQAGNVTVEGSGGGGSYDSGPFTLETLPDDSVYVGKTIMVSDGNAGSPCYGGTFDGTNWFNIRNGNTLAPSPRPDLYAGLQLWLRGSEMPASGTWIDSSPNAIEVPMTGVTRVTDGDSYACNFNGSGGYLSVPYSSVLNLTSAYTALCWVNFTSHVDYGVLFSRSNNSTSNDNLAIYDSSGLTYVVHGRVFGDSYDSALSESSSLPTGSWGMLAVTYDGINIKLFFDGALIETVAGTNLPSSVLGWWIGKTTHTAYNPDGAKLNAKLREICLYNVALAEEDIAALASAGREY